jgi:hypothetical protein
VSLADILATRAASGRPLEIRPEDIATGDDLVAAVRLAATAVKTLHTRIESVVDTPQQGYDLTRQFAVLVEALPRALQEIRPLGTTYFPYEGSPQADRDTEEVRDELVSLTVKAEQQLTDAYKPVWRMGDAVARVYGLSHDIR